MQSEVAHLFEVMKERVHTLSGQGKADEALRAVDAAIEKARFSLSEDEESVGTLAEVLELKGDLLRQHGDLEEARLAYLESLEMLDSNPRFTEALARMSCSVGVIYDIAENDTESIRFYERAIELYERLDPPAWLDIADISNNLGFIYRSVGNFEAAEELFLKGLEICHRELGKEEQTTATIYNNLGALYLASGFHEQAREMHMMALESRQSVLGDKHPDTAQSHSNLALTLVQTGEPTSAREHFQAAIAIYERHMKAESHQYGAVVENYAEFLRLSDDAASADALITRAKKKLAKVAT